METPEKKPFDSNMVWGVLLVALGVLFLISRVFYVRFASDLIGMLIVFGIGVPFYVIYRQAPKDRWWALIPAYVMWAVAGIIFLSMIGLGSFVGAYVLFAIALPFLYVYIKNKENWWALIPAGIMGSIGAVLLLEALWAVVPAVLIIAGIYLLVRELAGSRQKATTVPLTGPDADRPGH